MPVAVPHHSVVIHRDGKNIRPVVGKPFRFTDEEAIELLSYHPTCLRRPVNETIYDPEEDDPLGEPEVTSEETPRPRRPANRRAPVRPPVDDDVL